MKYHKKNTELEKGKLEAKLVPKPGDFGYKKQQDTEEETKPSIPIPKSVSNATKITEDLTEQVLLLCMKENPTDPKIAQLLIQWLDKKKSLTQVAVFKPRPSMEDIHAFID